jgi:hypothetical protein
VELPGRLKAALGMVATVVICDGPGYGALRLAQEVSGNRLAAGILSILAYVLRWGALALIGLTGSGLVPGPQRTRRLFYTREPDMTPEVLQRLRELAAVPPAQPPGPGRGMLRVVPVPEPGYRNDVVAVVSYAKAEYPLPGWEPHDIPVQAGDRDVFAWLSLPDGRRSPRASAVAAVRAGEVELIEYRPEAAFNRSGKLRTLYRAELGEPKSDFAAFVGLLGLAVVWAVVHLLKL